MITRYATKPSYPAKVVALKAEGGQLAKIGERRLKPANSWLLSSCRTDKVRKSLNFKTPRSLERVVAPDKFGGRGLLVVQSNAKRSNLMSPDELTFHRKRIHQQWIGSVVLLATPG